MVENLNKIEEEEEDDDDEGPPPGFDSLALTSQNNNALKDEKDEDEDEEDDDEGPPPGWPSIPQQNHQKDFMASDVEMRSKTNKSEDEGDGPPPGWHTVNTQQILPSTLLIDASDTLRLTCVQASDVEMGSKTNKSEDEGDGPPPGWHTVNAQQILPSSLLTDASDTEMGSKTNKSEDEGVGPPPGWHTVNTQQSLPSTLLTDASDTLRLTCAQASDVEMGSKTNKSEDEGDGPPPGWHTVNTQQILPSTLLIDASDAPRLTGAQASDVEMGNKTNKSEDEGDGPPPGWHSVNTQQILPSTLQSTAALTSDVETGRKEVIEDEDEDEDDGPPPGWQLIPQQQQLQTSVPPSGIQKTILANVEMGSKQDCEDENEGHPPESESIPMAEHSSPPTPPPQSSSSVASCDNEIGSKQEGTKNEEARPQIDNQPMSHLQRNQPIVPQSSSRATTFSSEMGQMVCGSCRQLLSYPQGAKLVKCSCCQTVNLVLEAHDVGQVKCGGCAVLLMYPYGAPSVRCSSCRYVTKIGAHNRRPTLSAQQARRRHASHQVQ